MSFCWPSSWKGNDVPRLYKMADVTTKRGKEMMIVCILWYELRNGQRSSRTRAYA